ncbi:MAG: portal protein, partial [Alphaproteobacteria bacterium]
MALFPNSHAPELAALRPEERRSREIECRHIVLPAERYGDPAITEPFVSLHVDVEHGHVMEAVGRPTLGYVIPRWQLVSGSAYGYSPPTVASIADARMLQDMTRTILEAGEKAVDPPMVATQEAVRSDLALYAGGVTYVDAAYDERLGSALRPISQDRSGLPLGLEMQQDVRAQIHAAWMLNKLTLPSVGGAMTAYEVGQRVQEYIRQAIPLFEPIEAEYNGALCDETFRTLRAVGAFGRPEEWPGPLVADAVSFTFENP